MHYVDVRRRVEQETIPLFKNEECHYTKIGVPMVSRKIPLAHQRQSLHANDFPLLPTTHSKI